MSKKTPIMNDFRAGELNPNEDVRADLKDYYRGCKTLENTMPIIEGGVARVPGSYYVRPVKQLEEGWNIRVTKSGDGTGVVTSDVAGISCGADCYDFFMDGSTVVLTATPDAGKIFDGWSGHGTGTVTRSVLMDGNKVVNAEFGAGWPLDFNAYDMATDGVYLYVCGGQTTVAPNYLAKISKIDLTTLVVIAEYEYIGTNNPFFSGIRCNGGFVYVAGYDHTTPAGVLTGLIQKIDTATLATVSCTYTLSFAPTPVWFQEPEVDDDFVYATGVYSTATVEKVKLNDSDGNNVWEIHTTSNAPVGINQDGTYIYIHKHVGGILNIERAQKSDGASSNFGYVDGGTFYRGDCDGTSLYIGGYSPSSGDTKGLTQKIKLSDMSELWQYRRNTTVVGFDDSKRCRSDGSNVYVVGQSGSPAITVLEKLDDDGNLVWTQSIAGKLITYGLILIGDYIYITGSPSLVERRLKTTGEIG